MNPYNNQQGYSYPDQASPPAPLYPDSMYDPTTQGDAYYGPEYYPATSTTTTGVGGDEYNDAVPDHPPPEVGSYVPVGMLPTTTSQDPVTALAYDSQYDAIYVATSSMSGGRRYNDHRASLLYAYNSGSSNISSGESDGMLYSSVAGHPEAAPSTLKALYEGIFGTTVVSQSTTATSTTATSTATPTTRRHIPSHAFRPPYGTNDPYLFATSGSTTNNNNTNQQMYQMGVQSLLGLEGHVLSVSPSGIRLHAIGGLQVCDRPIHGMMAATAAPAASFNTHHHHRAHTTSPTTTTHVTVGGMAWNDDKIGSRQHIMCLDIWQSLRTVSSYKLGKDVATTTTAVVTSLATNDVHGSIVAGCSDGWIRLVDGRLRDMARIKSHVGGTVHVAVSGDGTLLASTGYGSQSRPSYPLYGFPDPSVLLYDIRYLGRGGIPHPFAGLRGGSRFLSFLPDAAGMPPNRLMVASGQAGGGVQILEPFQESPSDASNFLIPPIGRDSITAMCVFEDRLAFGTSRGNVLQYRMMGYSGLDKTSSSHNKMGIFIPSQNATAIRAAGDPSTPSNAGQARQRQPIHMPPFHPSPPPLSLDASLLKKHYPNVRPGVTPQIKSIFGTYILAHNPTVTPIGDSQDVSTTSFGYLAASPLVRGSRLSVSASLLSKASQTVDFLKTIPTSELNLDPLEDHRPAREQAKLANRRTPTPNPNKFLYTCKLFPVAYEESLNRAKKVGRRGMTEKSGELVGNEEQVVIPRRYRLTIRPTHKSAASFSHSEYNETTCVPGWDYPPTMPNAFVPPVLMLVYCLEDLKSVVTSAFPTDKLGSFVIKETTLVPELSFMFHRIESISRCGMMFAPSNALVKLGAFAPSHFISCLSQMPEAEQLQILDGSPAAVDSPRRPEAFYRFLLYQIDKETSKLSNTATPGMDRLCGLDFVSINEFISGSDPPTQSVTRAMTVDLFYDGLLKESAETGRHIRFGDVLQRTLCRETRLRAWSQGSKAYETIVQRKIATSLPEVLSVSCNCAGRKEEDGLNSWRGSSDDKDHWLPEMIEVELIENGGVIVRESASSGDSSVWVECTSADSLPQSVSTIVATLKKQSAVGKRRYRLDAVLSMVRDDLDRSNPDIPGLTDDGPFGHLVLHARISNDFKIHTLAQQIQMLEDYLKTASSGETTEWTLLGDATKGLERRMERASAELEKRQRSSVDSEWVLVNGYVVSRTFAEDARAFHVKFKEPSIVIFRAVTVDLDQKRSRSSFVAAPVTADVLKSTSLTNGSKAPVRLVSLPAAGELLAFDAEFVCVEEEVSTLKANGSKVILRESRNALGRMSLIECRTRMVILDDYIRPLEPVVDYLTRFSGIVAKDLDIKQSPHHLIGTRAAYLKLRFMIEQGCIFVGHGLQQDFWTANLNVPASQVIDTVEIYRKPAQRYISLRFLTNFVLKRDMQQDVHDSVEDAMAAFELFSKALEMKKSGTFDSLLDALYAFGQKTDWKLGVDEEA